MLMMMISLLHVAQAYIVAKAVSPVNAPDVSIEIELESSKLGRVV